ncbi:Two component system response receiver/histidine kinase [Desulfonema magnum]|uniref:histidine kinase n=2 Tax=Desulfonema magnum TaxID=45655 RepID=A0A975GSG0_9BACT|nr:Two component system response receiver/histidine kinase [Desulfonema magnum]
MTSKNKILVVDDSPLVVEAISNILETEYLVEKAYSGDDALKTLQTFRPDMLLLDIIMPGMDGYEVCRQIRADGSFGFIKIIMVSSRTMLEQRLEGYNAGADDYISKPFDKEELLAKVRVFMRLKSVEDQLQELNETLNEQVRVRTRQLIDAEKMAVIGRYAAGIVHNLNNPLQAIMGSAQLLAMKYPDNRNIMILRKAAVQMKHIISTILTTSRRESKAEFLDIDLNEVLKDQIELLRSNPFFKHEIQTKLNIKPLPPYRCVYAHFSQGLGNLIKNAADAMYKSNIKLLSITTLAEDKAILIKISDTGHGIPEERKEKIFNPFFTTKPLTASDDRPTGTGLGLASSKEMIESYGGKILVESQVGKGTTFTVRLPIN